MGLIKVAARGDMAFLNRLREFDSDGSSQYYSQGQVKKRSETLAALKDQGSVKSRNLAYAQAKTIRKMDVAANNVDTPDSQALIHRRKLRAKVIHVGETVDQFQPEKLVDQFRARKSELEALSTEQLKDIHRESSGIDFFKSDTFQPEKLNLETGIPVEHAPSNVGSALHGKLSTRAKVGIGLGALRTGWLSGPSGGR